MSNDELRDAIAVTGSQPYSMTPCDADAILTMPEMQAIRDCLFRMAVRLADDRYDGVVRDVFTNYGLPESVIEWMGAAS